MIRLSRRKLRLFFSVFFLALATPALLLSWKAYQQLRWEAFHQYQQEAQSLSAAIDQSLAKAITREEARTDTDYTFLVLAGDPKAGFVQRSDLSRYPVESSIPGMIGYFQIDQSGDFSSPLLPQQPMESALYGISDEEKILRTQVAFNIRTILSENQLVASNRNDIAEALVQDQVDSQAEADTDSQQEEQGLVLSDRRAATAENSEDQLGNLVATPKARARQQADQHAARQAEEQKEAQSKKQQLVQERERKAELEAAQKQKSKQRLGKKEDMALQSPSEKFSKLEKEETQEAIGRQVASSSGYENVYEEETLKKVLTEKKLKIPPRKNNQPARAKRQESNYSPQQSQVQQSQTNQMPTEAPLQISLFQSELEPFRFSLLKSGHAVAYRQVWRNNQRLVQGGVIATETFIQQAIAQPFYQSPVSDIANVSIVYGNSELVTLSGESRNRYQQISSVAQQEDLIGEQLFGLNFSEPFNQISLIFNVSKMPMGKSASFIVAVTASLLIVLVIGTWLLYRLTLRHSILAQQQQDFVSSVSHELKTPLTSIRMYGEILKQGWMNDEKRSEYYDYIFNEAERLSRLISNVLQISKVNRDSLELELKPMSVSEIADMLRSKVDSQIAQSDFELKINISPEIKDRQILVDQDAVIQIVINLIDNAIKYAAKAEDKTIILEFKSNSNDIVSISVRDYGPGIKRSERQKVFDLFYRSGSELTRETTGTGIGLALIKELARAMQAKVRLVPHSKGVEFAVDFKVFDSGE